MSCARSPSAAGASAWRAAVRTSPAICSRWAASGQIHAVQANLRYPNSVAAAVRGADAVVNLVGILSENGRQRFETVHAFGAGMSPARPQGRRRDTLVHVSAIGADAESESSYARTKAAGEAAVREIFPTR